MKKEHAILAIFLAIVAVSGAFIYAFQSSRPPAAPHPPMGSTEQGTGAEGVTSPGPDTTHIRQEIAGFETQLKSDPNNYDLLVNLGNSYYDINDPPRAIEYYEKALKINSNDAAVLVDCGTMYRQTGNPDKAIELFNKAIQADPNLPQAYFNLGMVLRMEKGDPKGAARAWQKYLLLDPNSEAREFLQQEIDKALK